MTGGMWGEVGILRSYAPGVGKGQVACKEDYGSILQGLLVHYCRGFLFFCAHFLCKFLEGFLMELESPATLRSKTIHFYDQKFLFIYSSTTYMTLI